MILYCPRCGAALPVDFLGEWLRTNARCLECGVALDRPAAMLAVSDEELVYALDEWLVADRVALTTALATDGIPYRWEADIALVVPLVAEEEVDALLGDLEGDGSVAVDGLGVGVEGPDGGEEAMRAMGELFVAADRLWHAPLDQVVAADLEVAADVVGASLPPYGLDLVVWQRIRAMAEATVSSVVDGDDEDVIARHARALRDLLRQYV